MIVMIAGISSPASAEEYFTSFDVERCAHSIAINSQEVGIGFVDLLLDWNAAAPPTTIKQEVAARTTRQWLFAQRKKLRLRLVQEAMQLDILDVWIMQTYPKARLYPLTDEYCQVVFATATER